MYHYGELQRAPLNVITFGQSETDNIARLRTITGYFLYSSLQLFSKVDL
jgi:hypothetical protein